MYKTPPGGGGGGGVGGLLPAQGLLVSVYVPGGIIKAPKALK